MIPIDHSTPLWTASRIILAERKSDILRHWKLALKSFDAEDIHDLRVSSRRMREALELFSPCFMPKAVSVVSKAIRRLTRLLGTMRNTDEALLFFRSLGSDASSPGLEAITRQLERERKRERAILERELQNMSLPALRAGLEQLLSNPAIFRNSRINPFMKVAEYVRMKIGERSDAIMELVGPSLEEANITAQHRLRIAVKRLRYRYEIMSPLCGPEYGDLYSLAKAYQDLLGKIHDLDVFSQMAAERVADVQHRAPLLEEIARKRHELFMGFSEMMEYEPVGDLGNRMRRTL